MLENISVDGFRSLVEFKHSLRPGLNVIVGPNGAGKSNLISFLDFLGEFVEEGLDSAISTAKGAGSLFSIERNTARNAYLSFAIQGTYTTTHEGRLRDRDTPVPKGTKVRYKYSCKIRYNKDISQIFIESDSLFLEIDGFPLFTAWRSTQMNEIGHKNSLKLSHTRHPISTFIRNHWNQYVLSEDSDSNKDQQTAVADSLAPSTSLLKILPIYGGTFGQIYRDITSYRSINIEPYLARKSSPVSRMTAIEYNGENLAGTLYRLQRGEYYPVTKWGFILDRAFLDRSEQNKRFQSIVSWTREVNPQISDISVRLDLSEAMLRGYVKMSEESSSHEFPFTRLSDGTVKWITLVTILFSQNTFRTIEEPENFLHPKMQESFIYLCRDIIGNTSDNRQVIISTHSQTLLNCCAIEELTIFDNIGATTRARRAEDSEGLKALIEESGFGVGDLYQMGALNA